MDLILWRHAEAEAGSPEQTDLQRRLTAKGRKQAHKMGLWLNERLPESCKVLVSPSTRTRETVAALERKFKVIEELAPDASPEQLLLAANWPNSKESVLIVGHQPSLGQAASMIITPYQPECAIRKGSVWWISQKQHQAEGLRCYLKAIIAPELLLR
jgi:phosphohistidine phosphatase